MNFVSEYVGCPENSPYQKIAPEGWMQFSERGSSARTLDHQIKFLSKVLEIKSNIFVGILLCS